MGQLWSTCVLIHSRSLGKRLHVSWEVCCLLLYCITFYPGIGLTFYVDTQESYVAAILYTCAVNIITVEVYSRLQDRCTHFLCHIADVCPVTTLKLEAAFYSDVSLAHWLTCIYVLFHYLKYTFPEWRSCDMHEQNNSSVWGAGTVVLAYSWLFGWDGKREERQQSQSHKIVGAERDHWRLSSPTHLPKQAP